MVIAEDSKDVCRHIDYGCVVVVVVVVVVVFYTNLMEFCMTRHF